MTRVNVGIIGAGPAGLVLALLLHRAGISCAILELKSREYVESRVRAGLLEQNTVNLLNELDAAERLNKEGLTHKGVYFSFDEVRLRIPFDELTGGRCITIYGQQEIIKDLIQCCVTRGIPITFEANVNEIRGLDTNSPELVYYQSDEKHVLRCDFVAGCDGFHGAARNFLPANSHVEYRKEYPFSWLGILASASPSCEELIYAYHKNGFALHTMRSPNISRMYLQVSNDDNIGNWSDERIWEELSVRLHTDGFQLNTGEIIDKSITPMRSFMIDNLQYQRLFLAGDAAHIVPPTGGKGLNLAVADIKWLAEALANFYEFKKEDLLKSYTRNALRRVWRAQDFSNFMTYLFHNQSPHGSFEYQLQKARFEYIRLSKAYATTIAENYVGLEFV